MPCSPGALTHPEGDAEIVETALRGLARFGVSDYVGAATELEAAFAADTDPVRQARTGFFLGWAYAFDGDDRQAASAWRRAVFLDAALVPAHLALADAYVRLSQPALAAQVLQGRAECPARLAGTARAPVPTGALTLLAGRRQGVVLSAEAPGRNRVSTRMRPSVASRKKGPHCLRIVSRKATSSRSVVRPCATT